MDFPMRGVDGRDWVINNYVDLDPGSGLRDYRGNTGAFAKTYNGHNGVDIDVPNFRWMDGELSPVYAVAAGEVVSVRDGQFDRNMSCVGVANVVQVRHPDGRLAIYAHLKRGSVAVTPGQVVPAGTRLGFVGSSGCSTQPHLHFELRSPTNEVIDPFLDGLWVNPPVYETPLTFMDGIIRVGGLGSVDQIKDPLPNASVAASGSTLGLGVTLAGGRPGDNVRMVVRSPGGAIAADTRVTFDRTYRHSYWYWNHNLGPATGPWAVSFYLNEALARTYGIDVH